MHGNELLVVQEGDYKLIPKRATGPYHACMVMNCWSVQEGDYKLT